MYRKLWKPSPFYHPRGSYPLDMIVVHHIGSKDGKLYSTRGAVTWFTNEEVHRNPDTGKIENKVSAHYILPREPYDDHDVIHLVQASDIAYHAGRSQWTVDGKLRKSINNYSIGIELHGDGNLVEYTDYQYKFLIELVKELMELHSIAEKNIVGHEDIAPDRKVDPGRLFDWKRFREGLKPPPIVMPPATVKPDKKNDSQHPEDPDLSTVPDEEFEMESGVNNEAGLIGLIKSILSWIANIIYKK